MKSIFQYTHFRDYLKDAYVSWKKESQSASYAAFSEKAGLQSPNYLKLVMDGDRRLTVSNIHSFAKALGLKGTEREYFESLVLENQSDEKEEKQFYRRRVLRIKKGSAGQVVRTKPSMVIDRKFDSVLMLLGSGQTQDAFFTIAKRELLLSEKEIREGLNRLFESGSLVLDADGIIQIGLKHQMQSDPKSLSERQRVYLKAGLNEANEVFEKRYSKTAAKFLSLLMTAPEGSLEEIFTRVRAEVEKAAEDLDPKKDEAFGAYRVQLQVYRLCREET